MNKIGKCDLCSLYKKSEEIRYHIQFIKDWLDSSRHSEIRQSEIRQLLQLIILCTYDIDDELKELELEFNIDAEIIFTAMVGILGVNETQRVFSYAQELEEEI